MATGGSVTAWISELMAGEDAALAKLHARYWHELVKLARKKLQGVPAGMADEEDLVQAAFIGFHRTLKAGGLYRMENREHFLAFLSHLIARRAVNLIQRQQALKRRAPGPASGDSVLETLASDRSPTPLENDILNEFYQSYLGCLRKELRPFAELHLANFTYREIAKKVGCVERTVERKMALILAKWREKAAADAASVDD